MTTRFITKRFTAAQALAFLDARLEEASASDLAKSCALASSAIAEYDCYDRWQGLPPAFVKKWEVYRQLPIPLRVKLLRKLNLSHLRFRLTSWILKCFR
jgi:hypothetical protein